MFQLKTVCKIFCFIISGFKLEPECILNFYSFVRVSDDDPHSRTQTVRYSIYTDFSNSQAHAWVLSSCPRGLEVSSTMKSTKAYFLIAGYDLNSMLNLLSSIAHFNNLSDTSGFWRMCLRG